MIHRVLCRCCALLVFAFLSITSVARADLAASGTESGRLEAAAASDLNLSLTRADLLAFATPHGSMELVSAPAVLGRPRSRAYVAHERWSGFERNRRFAIAGKVLTVVGRVLTFGALMSAGDAGSPYWGLMGIASAGELMWSGSDLRATNQLRERGYRIRKGAAIASVVGAVVFAPLTWVAGPIQSGRLRDARDAMEEPSFSAGERARALAPGAVVLRF